MARRKREIGEKCEKGHTISGTNVRIVGGGTVICRECHNAYMRERYARVKHESGLSVADQCAALDARVSAILAKKAQLIQDDRDRKAAAEAARTAAARAFVESVVNPS